MAGGKLMAAGPSTPFGSTPKCRKGWSYSNYDRKCVKTIDEDPGIMLDWRQWALIHRIFGPDEEGLDQVNGDIDMSGYGKKGGEIKNNKIYTRDERLSSIKSKVRR